MQEPQGRPFGRRGESGADPRHVELDRARFRPAIGPSLLYCCDRVLAAEARFHDPPLPGLPGGGSVLATPAALVCSGICSWSVLPKIHTPAVKETPAPAPAPAKLAVLDCRARRDLRP